MGRVKGPVVAKISFSSLISETSLDVSVCLKENPKDHTQVNVEMNLQLHVKLALSTGEGSQLTTTQNLNV